MTPDKEYSGRARIRMYNCDNRTFMNQVDDNYYDLSISDPPYGLGSKLVDGGTWSVKWQDKGSEWDDLPEKSTFENLFRVSKNWVVWGGNYFIEYLPNCRNFIAWHKPYMDGMHSMGNVELALTSFDCNAKKISFNKDKGNNERIHVTQKPVNLYRWVLKNYAEPNQKIFDGWGGSMSIAIACWDLGFDLDICELDKGYFDAAVNRFEGHISQQVLF